MGVATADAAYGAVAPLGLTAATSLLVDGRQLSVGQIATPLGEMLAGATDAGLVFLEFTAGPRAERRLALVERRLGVSAIVAPQPFLEQLQREVAAFFAGQHRAFDVPVALLGTAFQQACWSWLRGVPFGETRSYAEAAACVGTSARAFAQANAANPLAIVVPCHRILGSDGSLTGYGGGLNRKRALIALERPT